MLPLILLLVMPLPAYAAETAALRFTDLVTWATLIGLVALVVVGWSRAREWADANLITALDLVRRTASPPRMRPWGARAAQPTLFGERWMEHGKTYWVRGDAAALLPSLIAELLTTPGVAVALHVEPRLAELAGAGLDASAAARLYVVQDLPTEHTLAVFALRGAQPVLVLDRPIQAELRAGISRWGAMGLSVGPEEPRAGGYAAVRSAP